jgi:ABC-type branched-subunit amino acid transport system permease subunit
MSGGLWFAVSYALGVALGTNPSLTDTALDAGMMSASAVGADVVHGMLGMNPTGMTSAVLTGAYFAGLQKVVRGDSNYLVNGGFAAANDLLVENVSAMQRNARTSAAMASEYEDEF